MPIRSGQTVSIEYSVSLGDEIAVDTNVGKEPLTFVQGAHQVIPGLENAVEGMRVDEAKKVVVKPEDAYGVVDPDAFIAVGKDKVPPEAMRVGAQLRGQTKDGQPIRSQVAEVKDDTVTLDFNHPLAGKTLYFDVRILNVEG